MPKPHIVQAGDTLKSIALATLGDGRLAANLADYNALPVKGKLESGLVIHIPSRTERAAPRAAVVARTRDIPALKPWPGSPHGMAAIAATFGDLTKYPPVGDNQPNPKWEADFIVSAKLPKPIPLTFDMAHATSSLRCHKLVKPLYEAVFADILAKGLWASIKTTAGGYNWRMKRGQAKPSTHTWGIAFDLNDRTNAMGTPGDMDPKLVALFESWGFTWGGRWTGNSRDPMHFQYCSGY